MIRRHGPLMAHDPERLPGAEERSGQFTATTALHSARDTASRSRAGAPVPALLNSRSTRPCRSTTASNRPAPMPRRSRPPGPDRACRPARRPARRPPPGRHAPGRPAPPSTPAARACTTAAPMPLPAPVTTATFGGWPLIDPSCYPPALRQDLAPGHPPVWEHRPPTSIPEVSTWSIRRRRRTAGPIRQGAILIPPSGSLTRGSSATSSTLRRSNGSPPAVAGPRRVTTAQLPEFCQRRCSQATHSSVSSARQRH